MKHVRWIGVSLAVVCGLLTVSVLTGCDIAELLGEEEEETNRPPYEALPALQAIVYAPRLIVDSDADDPLTAEYPTGMSVRSGGSATRISATLDDCQLIASSDVCLTGAMYISETVSGSTATIAFSGDVSLRGSSYNTSEIDAAVTFPVATNGHANTDAEPLEITGSVSLDGNSWAFADVLDAVEEYERDIQMEELLLPCRSRFFAAGYTMIGHSPDGRRWDALEIASGQELSSIAADEAGNLVAVGAGSFDYQPQGSGVIYYGSNADSWSLVKTTRADEGLAHVAWSDGLWVATGAGGAVYTSTDGTTWNDQSVQAEMVWSAQPGRIFVDGIETAAWSVVGRKGSEEGALWQYATHENVRAGAPQWVSVPLPEVNDDPNIIQPTVYTSVAYDPGTQEWIAYPVSTNDLYYWDGYTNSPEAVLSTSKNAAYTVPFQSAERIDIYTDQNSETVYRFLSARQDTNGVLYLSTVVGGTVSRQWASAGYKTTSGNTPLMAVVGGEIQGYDRPQFVMISGGGDFWYSDDPLSGSWTSAKRDWHGVRGLTYRPRP
ncbi:MAG: hypothetical protein WD492_04360 [Alkalispirochaeta sp.]